jgi:heparanase 1
VAEKWRNFDFDLNRLQEMAKALSPAYLRLGGTAADLLIFDEKGKKRNGQFWKNRLMNQEKEEYALGPIDISTEKKKRHNKFYMSGRDWWKLNDFTNKVGWNLLFDMNVLLRKREKPEVLIYYDS